MGNILVGPCGRQLAGLRVSVTPPDARPLHYVVRDLVAELTRQGALPQTAAVGPVIGRVLGRSRLALPPRLRRRRGPLLVPLIGARFGELYAAALKGDVVPFFWDVWEPQWDLFVQRLRPLRPPAVFVTALQAARFLANELPQSRVVHLPEATRMSWYSPQRPLESRTTGVLELGRRYEAWHDAVRGPLRSGSNRPHLYTRWSGQLLFPDESALHSGLADTMVSVCFPSSLTHPYRSGSVETMTHRYLESMASGCLVLGHAPAELVELMGFNPVVEVDWNAPADQVLKILAEPQKWQPHVDRSLQRLWEVGDWSVRASTIRATLEEIGLLPTLPDAAVPTEVSRPV